MKKFLWFALSLLLGCPVFGQGAHRVSQVIVRGNNTAANVSPNASILVCVVDTQCNSIASVYSDPGLSQPLSQPLTADNSGNYNYYVLVGCVDERISAPGQDVLNLKRVCPFNGVAGGGTIPSGTGFYHITSGLADSSARAVNLSGSDVTGQLISSSFPALTGDVTSTGGTLSTTLSIVNSAPGLCGDSTHVCQITSNGKGLVISQTPVLISVGGSGTVTSVGLALPGSVFAISGSPVTTTGTLTASFINQPVHTFFSGPSTGSATIPTFRTLVVSDLPLSLTGNTTAVPTASGSYATGHSIIVDSFDNFVDSGSPAFPAAGIVTSTGSGWGTSLSTPVYYWTWNIQTTLFSTSTLLSNVFYAPNAGTINKVLARFEGTITCSVAPVITVMDLGTSPTTVYGSSSTVVSVTTGTSDGVYSSGSTGAVVAAHYYGVGFSAGTCSTAPTISISAEIQ
jgi:hypothetical protein